MSLAEGDPSKAEAVLDLEREEAERWRYYQIAGVINEKIRIYKSIPPK